MQKALLPHITIVLLLLSCILSVPYLPGTTSMLRDRAVLHTAHFWLCYLLCILLQTDFLRHSNKTFIRQEDAPLLIPAGILFICCIGHLILWHNGTHQYNHIAPLLLLPSLLSGTYLMSTAVCTIRSIRRPPRRQYSIQALQQQTLLQEDALLRSQLTPHLMYNALTGAYSLVEESSPKAGRIVLLLTAIMSFALVSTETTTLHTLQDEIAQIHRIIELNRILRELQLLVEIQLPKNIQQMPFPPLLLVNLIENMFKHGDLRQRDTPGKICICGTESRLCIHLKNPVARKNAAEQRTGIGMNNTRKRLQQKFAFASLTDQYNEPENKYTLHLNINI